MSILYKIQSVLDSNAFGISERTNDSPPWGSSLEMMGFKFIILLCNIWAKKLAKAQQLKMRNSQHFADASATFKIPIQLIKIILQVMGDKREIKRKKKVYSSVRKARSSRYISNSAD